MAVPVVVFSAFVFSDPFAGAGENQDALADNPPLISMDFKDADLNSVLKILSQQSGLNFVASDEVKDRRISLYLDQVTVQDALDNIIRANDLRYERERGSGIFVLYPARVRSNEVTTMVFPLRHTRLSTSPLDVGGLSVVRDLAIRNEDLAQSDDETTSMTTGMTTGIFGATEETDQKRGIDEIISSLLSDEGKVTVDIRTNSLIVTDYPKNLDYVKEVLDQIDVPTRQVMIEVEILEVKASIFEDTGIEWGGTEGELFSFTGGARKAAFPFRETLFESFRAAAGDKSSLTLGTLSAENFKATLHFLITDQDTEILARPRVLTLNNEAAIIKLVTNTAIAKVATQAASEGVSVVTSDTAERTETGIVLKMTPQINEDDTIELFLEPSITTVAASAFFASDFLDPTTRSVRTTVRVKDEETLVIGGLIDRDDDTSVKKIPFLGDLPLVGHAFKYKERDSNDRELLIFLTPHIVTDVGVEGGISSVARTEHMKEILKELEMKRSLKQGEMERALDAAGQPTKS